MPRRDFHLTASMVSKFLAIMLMPLTLNLSYVDGLFYTLTSGFLLTSIFESVGYVRAEMILSGYLPGIIFRNLLLALIVSFPGFVYNYKIEHIRLNKSYWKMGFAVCIAIVLEAVAVAAFVLPYLTGGSNYWNSDYYLLTSKLTIYPTLVIGVFIILPLIERMSVSIASPIDFHDRSMSEILELPDLEIKRERRLARILWAVLCFSPFILRMDYYYQIAVNISSLLFYITYYSNVFDSNSYIYVYGGVVGLGSMQMMALYYAGNFYFVREIYQYLKKQITKNRLQLVGVLATFLPLMIHIFIPVYYYAISIGYNTLLIPIPSIFFFGLLIARFHKPMVGQLDTIWTDEEHHYWWDKEEKQTPGDEGLFSTPETPYRNNETLVKVPIRYRVTSKLKKLTKRDDE